MERIIIDPGHGGTEIAGRSTPYGSRGGGGLVEKDVNLELARRVAARLGPRAVLTRNSDMNVPLSERARRTSREGARAFLSLHANSGPVGKSGSEVWVHHRSGDASQRLAGSVHDQLAVVGSARGIYSGEMAVLTPELQGAIPAILVEADYLSDPHGEQRLRNSAALEVLGDAIARGVDNYLADEPTAEPLQQRSPPTTAVPEGAPSNPSNYHNISAGVLTADRTISVEGGQGMWFHFENANALGVQFRVTSHNNLVASVSMLPRGTADFVFTTFGTEPMGWRFDVRFVSSARVVSYQLKGTWTQGMPPNR